MTPGDGAPRRAALSVENVSYAYPGGGQALRDATADLSGGLVLLAGPNGGGKSTLLHILSGVLRPGAGEVRINGEKAEPEELRRLGRLAAQDADMQIFGTSVEEDVLLGVPRARREAFRGEALRLAGAFSLDRLWTAAAASLSYGQKRKLCLLHALLAKPGVLLMDEPFAGLDYPAALELRAIIEANKRDGICQIISTHDPDPVIGLADRVAIVASGRVEANGPPESVRERFSEHGVKPPHSAWA